MRRLRPERLLELTARVSAEGDARTALRAFTRFLLLHLWVREVVRISEGSDGLRIAWAVGFGACLLVSLHRPWLRAATLSALAVGTWKWFSLFPGNSNHFFLEWLCLLGLGTLGKEDDENVDDDETEGSEAVDAFLRWIPILVLFWSGANKLLYGTYFNGAFLASTLGSRSFASVFGLLTSDAELRALLATRSPGPWAFESWPALIVSNGVYLGEMLSAVLLLSPRTRAPGLILAGTMLVGIEAGARELLFGTLMLNLLVLFLPSRVSVATAATSASAYALLLATRLWIAPAWPFN